MKSTQHILDNFEKAVGEITGRFLAKYFKGVDTDHYWIGDNPTHVLSVNDYFFTLERIYEAIKINAKVKDFFDYYDLELEDKPVGISFENYCKYPELRKERQ